MFYRFILHFYFALMFFLPLHSYAGEPKSNFRITGRELQNICETEVAYCETIIQSFLEGMEFAYILLVPDEIKDKDNLFCLKDANYLSYIRSDFLKVLSQDDDDIMLDEPAFLSLVVGLQKHQCR